MNRYRVVVQIPGEVFIDANTIEEAERFMTTVASVYDTVPYPQSSTSPDRSGVCFTKIMSIESAIEGESEGKEVVTISRDSDTQPPQGPSIA